MLPDEMFVPLIDMPRKETDEMGCLDVGYVDWNWNIQLENFIKKVKILADGIKIIHFIY
jgi:hypothetical protein